MKARHWILAVLVTILLAGGIFTLLAVFGGRLIPESEPEALQVEMDWDAYEKAPDRPRATKADSSHAMQLNVVPGVTRTRKKLNEIERAREDIRESAGEDAPERY